MAAEFPQAGAMLSVRLPYDTRNTFAALASARGQSASGLLRELIDLEIAGRPGGAEPGEVEAAVRAELAGRAIPLDNARAAAAVNVARRLDRDPASGPANAGALRGLLDQLMPVGPEGVRPEVASAIRALAAELETERPRP
jgi:hypothetical protein